MDEIQSWFAGVDWASQKHDVWLANASGKRLGKRTFAHSGVGLAQMCDWLIATSGGKPEDRGGSTISDGAVSGSSA